MLVIRADQLKVFSRREVERFEAWMLVHLKKFFPAQCRALGDIRLREMIRSGIERAAGYRITARRDVCKYIDLMAVFGRNFDNDGRYPWAKTILASGTLSGQRIRTLHETAQEHLRRL